VLAKRDLVPIEHSEIIDRPEDDGGRNDKRVGCVSRPPCDGGERCGKVGIRLAEKGRWPKTLSLRLQLGALCNLRRK
jgi:hypothetical protein